MNFDFSQEYILDDPRVELKPLSLENARGLKTMALNEVDLLQFSPPEMHTEEKFEHYISDKMTAKANHKSYPFIIADKQSNLYAGTTSFLNISVKDERLEIGSTWIGNNFQRTGLNRHCKFLLLEFVFEQLGAKRVELKTDARNKKSRTAILGIGARFEGILRSHTVMSDGFRRDTVYYSILASEWMKVKANFKIS